ncbi:helix-turn-helix transcriptional regulator [Micromonospora sp. WMMD812]|uniref:helix-turn-helix transcriptional regulator n=1 Tax=Micromonospora sp. WMMD812 TaxID=3015152 RepID=UPI00248BC8D6|nr:helix-turn-helix transcriptional regulator [Micromonospora sp. WMMD812]WBB70768.1 helix-turn-helix transcriptional regulator [Micromonospora sp. WMMD812]
MALKRYRLVQRRKMLGFSQERLAEALGVERSTVVRWERAENDPQPWHRIRIADALQMPLDQLQEILDDVSVATPRGSIMGDSTGHTPPATRADLLADLRAFLTRYLPNHTAGSPSASLPEVRRAVARVHGLYQRASYVPASRHITDVLRVATGLTRSGSGIHRATAFKMLAAAYVAASKIGCKVGDGETALLAADRAATSAQLADDQALAAVAAYQAACALLRFPDRIAEAEAVTDANIDHLARLRSSPHPDLISAQGALLLLAAIIAARRGDTKRAGRHLSQAQTVANDLGSDQNRLWTGFGPTNVTIHAVSAAVAAGNAERAIDIGSRLDTSRLPIALVGRRAQVHLDLAEASATGSDGSSLAVLHLLEAERVAPEVLGANVQARSLLLNLLSKERRSATPGLRPMAVRAGLLT